MSLWKGWPSAQTGRLGAVEPALGEPPAPLLYCTAQKTPDNGMTFGLFLLRDTGLAPGSTVLTAAQAEPVGPAQ